MLFPTDLKETVVLMLSDNLKDMNEVSEFINTVGDDLLRYHHGLGTMIRNHYKLWEDTELEKYVEEGEFVHPDDISYDWMKEAQRLMKV